MIMARRISVITSILLCFVAAEHYMSAQSQTHAVKLGSFIKSGGITDVSILQKDRSQTSQAGYQAAFSLGFPRFDIYSPTGDLLYHTTDIDQVRHVLRNFRKISTRLSPLPRTDSWPEVVAKFPELQPSTGQFIFLSIRIEDCDTCRIEEDLLAKAGKRDFSRQIRQEVLVLKP
jgi:hypothetical protein